MKKSNVQKLFGRPQLETKYRDFCKKDLKLDKILFIVECKLILKTFSCRMDYNVGDNKVSETK